MSAVEALEGSSAEAADLAVGVATNVLTDVHEAGRALSRAWSLDNGENCDFSLTSSPMGVAALDTAQVAVRVLRHASHQPTSGLAPSGVGTSHAEQVRSAISCNKPAEAGKVHNAILPASAYTPMPTRAAVLAFLRSANPVAYGTDEQSTKSQRAALEDAAMGVSAMMTAVKMEDGTIPIASCPLSWPAEDPRNVWALEGRFRAQERDVQLPLLRITAKVQQRWSDDSVRRRSHSVEFSQGGCADDELHEVENAAHQIEGHSTAAACWDGSVVLADLLCLPPAVLLSHSPTLSRSLGAYKSWMWSDKTVVELGCGIAALPSLVATLNGARQVVCTDGNDSVLHMTRANAARWREDHPRATEPIIMPLRWGDFDQMCAQMNASGVATPVDVILAADCIYVLDNPGAWGKLMRTIVTLSGPNTLTFLTYTDRGHNRLWEKFVEQRVQKLFHVVRVGSHLLHPVSQPGAPGRLEQHNPECQVFCWTLRQKE